MRSPGARLRLRRKFTARLANGATVPQLTSAARRTGDDLLFLNNGNLFFVYFANFAVIAVV
jgi:hypothetical protein